MIDNQVTAKDNLQRATENLYATFARYPLKQQMDACDHCVFPEDHQRIHSKPLQQLTGEDLQKYAFKAMSTWGDAEDFKHFFPRLLELWAKGEIFLVLPDSLFRKMEDANWRKWPQPEQDTIEEYFVARWRFALTSYPPSTDLQEFEDVWEIVFYDPKPLIDIWRDEARKSVEALRNIVSHILERSFWHSRSYWLFVNPDTVAMLEGQFYKYSEELFAEDVAKAVDQLTWLITPAPNAHTHDKGA